MRRQGPMSVSEIRHHRTSTSTEDLEAAAGPGSVCIDVTTSLDVVER
jgi:hypothetical protein